MTKTIRHGIFLVSLFASIGMMLFTHYAQAASMTRSFGTRITTEMQYPYVCQSGTGPYIHSPYGKTYQPSMWLSTNGGSRQVTGGRLGPNKQVLGLYSTAPSSHCYIEMGIYRIPVQTNVMTYFGTSK